MLSLFPLDNKKEIADFFEAKGLVANENSGCVLCKNGDEVLGLCLYDLSDKMVIRYIEPLDDIALADGILRSTLHVATERFVTDSFYADTVPEDFFKKIGFIKNKEERRLDTDKLFKSCQSCGK